MLAGVTAQAGDVVERVDEAQVRIFQIIATDRGVGRLDVQIGDVIRQDRDFVGVQFFQILVLELGRLPAEVFEQLADEGAGSRRRIENLHILVDQVAAEVLLAQPVGRLDHEAHDFVGRVDDAETIRRFWVVDLVEVLVDDLEKGLFLVVAADLAGAAADRGVIGFERLQRLVLGVAGEEGRFELIQLVRDVVVLVIARARKHQREDFLGEDVLDQDFAHILRGQRGIDRLVRLLEELVGGGMKCLVARVSLLDHRA